jgi:hypothetical protein
MNKISGVKLAIVIILLLGAIATAAAVLLSQQNSKDKEGDGNDTVWVLLDSYKHVEPGKAACDALIPECGYCPGEVRGKECYVQEGSSFLSSDEDWILVPDYRHVGTDDVTCMALIPSCGYCPGEVRGNQCYVQRVSEFCKLWGEDTICWTPIRDSAEDEDIE